MSLKSWEIREEQVRAYATEIANENNALNFIRMGKLTLEDIAIGCNLTLDRVNELASSIQP